MKRTNNEYRKSCQSDRPIIALAPTANWEPKVWPADRFAAAFRTLAETVAPNAVAVVLGGPGAFERAMAGPLLAALPDALDQVGRLVAARGGGAFCSGRHCSLATIRA